MKKLFLYLMIAGVSTTVHAQ
ncbi:MAG: hypothetical protein JWQ40_1577, partial [Segetibacter sp.]|nr:hypothetical protein [Segetibacter sp.]